MRCSTSGEKTARSKWRRSTPSLRVPSPALVEGKQRLRANREEEEEEEEEMVLSLT
jgi:hypothetical protein